MKYATDHKFSTSEKSTETPRQISVKPGAKSPEQFNLKQAMFGTTS